MSSSGLSTPTSESEIGFSGVSTPATEGSVLFDDDFEFTASAEVTKPITDDFILVVGGLGYIGSHTSFELLKTGQNIIIIDNLSNCNIQALKNLEILRDNHFKLDGARPIIDFHSADFRNQDAIKTILTKYQNKRPTHAGPPFCSKSKISGVIHFAGYKSVSQSFQKPLEYYANNVSGMVEFLTTLSKFDIKTFVFSSSATVYGELANSGNRLVETQCDATSCSGLTNPYGRTKWMCEAILNDLAVSDPEWTIIALRYFNPIGCDESGMLGENPKDTPNNLMPIVVQAMKGEREHLDIFGTDWDTHDGTAIRDFIHVSDLAAGHLAALRATKRENFGPGFHVYNLGTGTGHSVMEIVTAMQSASGRTIPTKLSPRRGGDVGICVAEPSKSAVNLNWKTRKTLEQACWDICRYIGQSRKRTSAV
jgi:UDP-glucose 4-epimerase